VPNREKRGRLGSKVRGRRVHTFVTRRVDRWKEKSLWAASVASLLARSAGSLEGAEAKKKTLTLYWAWERVKGARNPTARGKNRHIFQKGDSRERRTKNVEILEEKKGT